MTCEEAAVLISAALDGELTGEDRRSLDRHLAACPDCAALFEALAGQSRCLRELDCQVPDGLAQRILSQLPDQAPTGARRPCLWRRWGALAACLALALLAGRAAFPAMGGSAAPSSINPTAGTEASGDTGPAPNSIVDGSADSPGNGLSGSLEQGSAIPYGQFKSTAACAVQSLRVQWTEALESPGVWVLTSVEELDACLARVDGQNLSADLSAYDRDYFESGSLIAVTLTESSGSISHTVEEVRPAGDGYEIVITRHVPEIGTCDIAAWLILIEAEADFAPAERLTVLLQN